MSIKYVPLAPQHFAAIVELGNDVHGDNYLNLNTVENLYQQSWSQNINASWVAIDTDFNLQASSELHTPEIQSRKKKRILKDGLLVGFRLTIAANNWNVDEWCSPQDWSHEHQNICYFKCNTVDINYRGSGIGSTLLARSIERCEQQGARAGLAHIWLASPGNSAYRYFTACGGRLIKKHPNKWQSASIEDEYVCPVCQNICCCVAAEMLLEFSQKSI
ncbi:GNAT family N-acetyltransferase [Glaciecola petra]|uniref:GNAT family N-acetyltransferase n=1 Tax=Glaciecola petra TaxID=3075602 RepID=A0ABU2ZPV6_9ALTE|nr:GNAT family N-acetyltransferase [Aestuariibacter sp. P117]MDT0594441.1 GNAT family N-acetyltransferase [Aestuariibacter sp. P117]